MTTVAVIQARMGSTRLPGKVLEPIAGRPLILWTIAAVSAIEGLDALVVATTKEPADDPLVDCLNEAVVAVHRGSVHDVLLRVVDAVEPYSPTVVVRQTADNPFPDPDVMTAQVRLLEDGPFDYVGIAGLPLGIGAEAVRWAALVAADREAVDPADREHVLPFVARQPERFRIGALAAPPAARHQRFTVDTPGDLALARAIGERLPDASDRPPRLSDLEAVLAADPALGSLNEDVEQRGPDTAQLAGAAPGPVDIRTGARG